MSSGENTATKNAQTYFRRAGRDETAAKQIRKKERAAEAAKTANLRRLRLEKEAAEKEAADRLAAENGGPPAKPAAARKRRPLRLIY